MKKNKRILIIAKNIDGGTGTFLSQFMKIKSKTSVGKMRTLILKRPKFFHVGPRVGNETVYYPGPIPQKEFYDFSGQTIRALIHELRWFKKQIDTFHPDIIVALDTHCCLFSAILTQIWYRNVHTILTFHNNIGAVTFYKLSRITRWLLRILCAAFFNRVDFIVSVSMGAAKDLKKYFFLFKNVLHIPYGLNTNNIRRFGNKDIESRDKIFFTNQKTNIISIGRFVQQKDFYTLIRAFKIVKNEIPRAQLLLLGDGEEKEKLKLLTRSLDMEKDIVFLGWRKNVYPYIKRSSIFVLSSHYEGFSYVILEAMSIGLPVVATDTPFGPSELLVEGKYGKLVPMHSTKLIAKEIVELMRNKRAYRKYSELSKRRALYYKENDMLRAYAALINAPFMN